MPSESNEWLHTSRRLSWGAGGCSSCIVYIFLAGCIAMVKSGVPGTADCRHVIAAASAGCGIVAAADAGRTGGDMARSSVRVATAGSGYPDSVPLSAAVGGVVGGTGGQALAIYGWHPDASGIYSQYIYRDGQTEGAADCRVVGGRRGRSSPGRCGGCRRRRTCCTSSTASTTARPKSAAGGWAYFLIILHHQIAKMLLLEPCLDDGGAQKRRAHATYSCRRHVWVGHESGAILP